MSRLRSYADAVSSIAVWKICIIIFLAGAAVRVTAVVTSTLHPSLHWDAAHDVVIARNLAEGNGFVNEPGQPTAYRYPLHPLVLSLVFRVIGERYVAVCLLQA
jgi:hypothetical protein